MLDVAGIIYEISLDLDIIMDVSLVGLGLLEKDKHSKRLRFPNLGHGFICIASQDMRRPGSSRFCCLEL
jgi:hypothetical protein